MPTTKLTLKQSTPALIGYKKSEKIDERFPLRPTSIKGVWRWFARAFVGGVLYDRGLLCGRKNVEGLVRAPLKKEVEIISKIVGKELGLGYAGESDSSSALLKLRVFERRKPSTARAIGGRLILRGRYSELQRVRLLTLGRRSVEYFYDGMFDIVVRVDPRLGLEKQNISIRILLAALSLSGLGKGSRRGLGSFDIIGTQGVNYENDLREFIENTYKGVESIVSSSRYLKNYLMDSRGQCSDPGLPPFPVISKKTYKEANISMVYLLKGVNWIDMHNFFVRPQRCYKLYKRRVCSDALRENLNAWILGLPRMQRGTGYSSASTDRRASPIIVSNHTRSHLFGEGTFILATVSGDWPSKIYWKGGYRRVTIAVDEERVVNAEMEALRELLRYSGYPSAHPVWPGVA